MGTLGVDEGGTFTDFVFISDNGEIQNTKVHSGGSRIIDTFLKGLQQMGIPLEEVDRIIYGTTRATNAVIEGSGPEIGLLCTRGFRDILDHQRWHQRVLYDLHQKRPEAIVKRRYRCQISERTSGEGKVLFEPQKSEIQEAIEFLKSEGITAIAVAFLNSYANPNNELLVDQSLRELGVQYITLSSELAPIISEWERASTAVLNAYTQPIIGEHLGTLQDDVSGLDWNVQLGVMQSNGGIMPVKEAFRTSVRTMLSGPAGGVAGAKVISNITGYKNIIGVDMGGTSCDVSVIRNGEEEITKEGEIDYNLPIRLPMIRIKSIGAGGGSIAYIDKGGSLKVGPESAGAIPGPACYNRGGNNATVTDAHLILNHLPASGLAGGRMVLDRKRSESVIGDLASQLGLSITQTAAGILRVADNLMVEAIRLTTVDRGIDPRDFALVAFGGMAPMHACRMADELGIRSIIIPSFAGVLSAFGLAVADIKTEIIQSINKSMDNIPLDQLHQLFTNLENGCKKKILEQRLSDNSPSFIWSADMRYPEQTFDIRVPVWKSDFDSNNNGLIDRFHQTHDDLYAYSILNQTPFLVNIEVTGVVKTSEYSLAHLEKQKKQIVKQNSRSSIFINGEPIDVPVYLKEQLYCGQLLEGPAFIDQEGSTVLITPGWVGEVDDISNLILNKE